MLTLLFHAILSDSLTFYAFVPHYLKKNRKKMQEINNFRKYSNFRRVISNRAAGNETSL